MNLLTLTLACSSGAQKASDALMEYVSKNPNIEGHSAVSGSMSPSLNARIEISCEFRSLEIPLADTQRKEKRRSSSTIASLVRIQTSFRMLNWPVMMRQLFANPTKNVSTVLA